MSKNKDIFYCLAMFEIFSRKKINQQFIQGGLFNLLVCKIGLYEIMNGFAHIHFKKYLSTTIKLILNLLMVIGLILLNFAGRLTDLVVKKIIKTLE